LLFQKALLFAPSYHILQILLTRIVSPEEERERASKVLRLNGGTDYRPRLLAASTKPKPTVRIKRFDLGSKSNSSSS
jgi:hypothetical protein